MSFTVTIITSLFVFHPFNIPHPPPSSIFFHLRTLTGHWLFALTISTCSYCSSASSIMAFNNSITARYDELRSPNPPSSSNSSASKAPSSRYSGSFLPNHSQPFGSDTRTSLQRRQTTDLSKMPAITPIGQPPAQIAESVDMSASVSGLVRFGESVVIRCRFTSIFWLEILSLLMHCC